MDVISLLEYLQELIENAPRVPITGKIMLEKGDVLDVVDQIRNYLPDELKKAQWLLSEKERILSEAHDEYDNVKKETMEILRKQVENHDITKEAQQKAEEIISLSNREAKAIKLGARDYADEILCELEKEIQRKGDLTLKQIEEDMKTFVNDYSRDIKDTTVGIRENIKELRNLK